MKLVLEIYFKGDCIERREYEEPFTTPAVGEQIYVEFANRVYSEEHGNWWVVRKRRHLMFSTKLQTLMLNCEPDPTQGE